MLFFAPCLGIRLRRTLHAGIVAEHDDVVLGLRQGQTKRREERGERKEKTYKQAYSLKVPAPKREIR